MLAVAVECRPLDGRGTCQAPVEVDFLAVMADNQITSFERRRQADDKRADLAWGTRCIDMFTEMARRPGVSLYFTCLVNPDTQTCCCGWPYVQLVEICSHHPELKTIYEIGTDVWQENLLDVLQNAKVGWVETASELSRSSLPAFR